MCTIGAIRINGSPILFKNRDKLEPEEEYVDIGKNGILIRSAHNQSIATGLNRHGFAFVRAEVVPVEIIKLAYSGNIKEAVAEIDKKINPSTLLELNLGRIKTVHDAIDILKSHKNGLRASNLVLADKNNIFSLEINDFEINVTEVKDCIYKTNYFRSLHFGPKEYSDYPSSYEREDQISSLIGRVKTIDQLKNTLANHGKANSDFNICRHGISSTISSCIIDVTGLIWHCNSSPCSGKFRKYVLS